MHVLGVGISACVLVPLPPTRPVTLAQVMGTLWVEVPEGFELDDLKVPLSAVGYHDSGKSQMFKPCVPKISFH